MSAERNQPGDTRKLPDEEARRLFARATEIESAQSRELSLSELREVALEAGIAPNAVEQAVIEFGKPSPIAVTEADQSIRKVRSRFVTALLESARIAAVVIATLLVIMLMVDLLG